MELKATLNKPYTDRQRCDFIVENNHQKSFEIIETEDALEAWGMTEEEQEDDLIENLKKSVRALRNSYLEATDKYMIEDFPIDSETKNQYKYYRKYLREYTEEDNWWKSNPKTFEEWIENKE